MKVTWSVPVPGERLRSGRGDMVRARCLIEGLRAEGLEVHVVEAAKDAAAATGTIAYRRIVQRLLPRRPARMLRDAGRWAQARMHARRVAAAALAQRADLIIETQVHFAGSGARAGQLTGLPLLLDDCSPVSEEQALGAGLPPLARRVFQAQVRAARHLVVPSSALREHLAGEGVPLEKLHVVPNGVDPSAYRNIDRAAVRRRLGIRDECLVSFVGSFQPWHRVDALVEALARLPERADVHLLLIGDGPTRADALAAVRRLGLEGRVSAIGAIPPEVVPAWVAACDIGVLPGSTDYCQPMKLLDYAAAGLAVVAPALGPVRELVGDDDTCILFPPGDVSALSQALTLLACDPARRDALGARARVLAERASWQARARDLVALMTATPARTAPTPRIGAAA